MRPRTSTSSLGRAIPDVAFPHEAVLSAPSASRVAGLLALDLNLEPDLSLNLRPNVEDRATGSESAQSLASSTQAAGICARRSARHSALVSLAIFAFLVAALLHAGFRSGSLAAPASVPPGHFEATFEESAMRKNPKSFAVAAAAALSVGAGAAAQDAVQWRVEDGGNGHWYAWKPQGSFASWFDARDAAAAIGGYLASIRSESEENFARSVIGRWTCGIPAESSTAIGGFQPNPSDLECCWEWVSGESWTDWTPWAAGEPSDNPAGFESVLLLKREMGWNDGGAVYEPYWSCRIAAMFEWSADCNSDGIVDFGQIRAGELEDANANNVPDCCEGQLVSWGDNSLGQSTPPILRAPIASIAAGYDHSSCLLSDGTVLVWGYNAFGQRDVPANLQNVVQISAGDRFMLALQANGVVRAWGFNDYGQCNVPADLPFIVKISAGGNHSMAQLSDGTLRCWGNNTSGESTVPTDLGSVSVFEGGVYHSIAVTTSSLIRCWGLDDYGQCTPPKGITTAVAVSGGDRHSVALLANGSVRCWGQNTYGQCTPPTDLPPLTAISASDRYTLGLTTAGRVVRWGVEIGQIPGSGTVCTMIAAGAGHGIAALEQAECPTPCSADITGNGNVDAADLAAVLSAWGGTPTGKANADVNSDGSVDAADLAAVLSSWGPCP